MGKILDFMAAHERLLAETPPHPILAALDALALALVDHGHTWTDRERQLYETAVDYLVGPAPPDEGER